MSPESPAGRLCQVGLSCRWVGAWRGLQPALRSRRGPASAACHLGSAPGARTAPDVVLMRGWRAEPDGARVLQARGWGWGLKGRSGVGAEGGHHAGSLLVLRVFVSPLALNLESFAVSLLSLSISIPLSLCLVLFASVSLSLYSPDSLSRRVSRSCVSL